MPDFDTLVNNARSGEIEQLNHLYRNFFELENWVFVSPVRDDMENAKPFIGVVNEQPWLFVFTDETKAHTFCKATPGFMDASGNSFFIRIQVNPALEMMYQLHMQGVHGIRVNDGENGWFCPLADIPNIIAFLKESTN